MWKWIRLRNLVMAVEDNLNWNCLSIWHQLSRHFFGSNHGKNECAEQAAIVKRLVSDAIQSGTIFIDNEKDLYDFLVSKSNSISDNIHYSNHKARIIFLCNSVDRNRFPEETTFATVKGTWSIHVLLWRWKISRATKVMLLFEMWNRMLLTVWRIYRSGAGNISFVNKFQWPPEEKVSSIPFRSRNYWETSCRLSDMRL